VEIYLDANNTKTTSYNSTDHQFGFDWGIAPTTANMYGTTPNTGIVFAIPAVTGGYNLAAKIPWSTIGGTAPTNGKAIGFDININDNDGGNANKTRQATSGWFSSSNQEFTNPSLFGTATLTVCNSSISAREAIPDDLTATNSDAVLMPNPATQGYVKVLVPGWQGDVTIRIIAFDGSLVQEGKAQVDYDSKVNIDITNLKAGAYIVQLWNAGNIITKKFLVK